MLPMLLGATTGEVERRTQHSTVINGRQTTVRGERKTSAAPQGEN